MLTENTSNLSFKKMQYKLQDSGVENCFFMNETINKDLVDVDVYQTLDKYRNDQKKKNAFIAKVKVECEKNIWYFFREVVRIPDDYHILANDNTGLSKYPLTESMCKLIYMYDNGLNPVVICRKNDASLSYLTLVCLAIREEFFLTHDIDYDTAFVYFSNHNNDTCEIFKSIMHEFLWGMNDVIGSIDGLTPKHNGAMPWNFKLFKAPQKGTPLLKGRHSYISPYIDGDDSLKKFLDDCEKRNYKYCVGRIVDADKISALDIYDRYILDSQFSIKNDYSLFDTDLDMIDVHKQFEV